MIQNIKTIKPCCQFRILFIVCSIFYTSQLYCQDIDIKLIEIPPYKVSQDITIEIYLINTSLDSLTYFDSQGPSWESFSEVWDLNVNSQYVEILPLNGAYDHNFNDSTFITLPPGDTNLIRKRSINLKTAGTYSFTYTQDQGSKLINKKLADASVSDSIIQKVNTFKVSKNIKFDVYNNYDTLIHELNTMSWEEWKEFRPVKLYSRNNHFDILSAALKKPQEVYSLTLYCDNFTGDEIKRIGRLKNLKALTLRNYMLNYYPKELAELDLYELTLIPKTETAISFSNGLSNNRTIRELTTKFYGGFQNEVLRLKDLEFLDICDCPIISLPMLDSLENLEVLVANNTQLSSINNVGFDKLLKLKDLNLSGNKEINDLTPLLNCNNLEFLVINRTNIQTITDEIENLKKLKKLSISSNLISISDSIGKLDDMRYLSFGGNRKLTAIPSTIVNMKKLLHLDISNTKIDHLPEGLSALPLEKVFIYNTDCNSTKDYKELKNRLNDNFKE